MAGIGSKRTADATGADAASLEKRYREDQEAVRGFYNSKPRVDLHSRGESRIFQLRQFNNFVKSCLIATYVRSGDCVFDICCGKGGDLQKWFAHRIGYLVMADWAEESVREAMARYNQFAHEPSFAAKFIAADCFKVELWKVMEPWVLFDLVSCQFAMHYAFQSESRVRNFLRNVSERLRPEGVFIATIPNAEMLVKRALKEGPRLGNSVFSVQFDSVTHLPKFGARYVFHLEDAVDSPEFLVHLPTLEKLAQEFGLFLELCRPFHEYFLEMRTRHGDLLRRQRVPFEPAAFEPAQWEAVGIYLVLAFRKRPGPLPAGVSPSRHYPRPHPVGEEDLRVIRVPPSHPPAAAAAAAAGSGAGAPGGVGRARAGDAGAGAGGGGGAICAAAAEPPSAALPSAARATAPVAPLSCTTPESAALAAPAAARDRAAEAQHDGQPAPVAETAPTPAAEQRS